VPWTVFTDPEIGQVGLDEIQARERAGGRVAVHRWPIERIDRAQADGEFAGLLKALARPNGRLLGATIVSPNAGELANELALAPGADLSLQHLARAMHVYPTYSIALQQLASAQRVTSVTSGWRGRLLRELRRLPSLR
jgi:pyruvate/2-oxoglutarate dehydrogenase complex dihydrolipoamide dehydrogenase (E3) component